MFLSKAELTTHIYGEVMDAISDNDDSKVTAAIRAAIGEATGYLGRYDTAALFTYEAPVPDPENPDAVPEDPRDPILLMYVKDIAVWHFIVLANPNLDLDLRKSRYEAAGKWLAKIQSGKVTMPWPLMQPEDRLSYFQYGSNPRRGSHF